MGILTVGAAARSQRTAQARILRRAPGWTIFYLVLVIALIPFLLPLLWMVVSAFKPEGIINAYPPIWAFQPTLSQFRGVLSGQDLPAELMNSTVIGLSAVALGMFLGLPAAYSIARYRQHRLAALLLAVRMVPFFAALIPLYLVFKTLGLTNNLLGIIIGHLVITVPLTTWIMMGFFEDVPRELEEAAAIDGCSRLGTFGRIAVPLVMPGLVAAAVLCFLYSWNNFEMALVLGGVDTKTAPLVVLAYMGPDNPMDWGGMTAAATLVIAPTFLFVLFVQRYLVKGLTMGGIKG